MSKFIMFFVLASLQVASFQETDNPYEDSGLLIQPLEGINEEPVVSLIENQDPTNEESLIPKEIGSEQATPDAIMEENQAGSESSLFDKTEAELELKDSEENESNSESESNESEKNDEFSWHKEAEKLLYLVQSLLGNNWGKKEDQMLKETVKNWFGNNIWNYNSYDDDSYDDWANDFEDENLDETYSGLSSFGWLNPFSSKEKSPISKRFSSI